MALLNFTAQKELFVENTDGLATVRKTLSRATDCHGLWLHQIIIEGVPTTAGFPDYQYYNLLSDTFHIFTASTARLPGIKIPLTGGFTYTKFEPAIQIVEPNRTLPKFQDLVVALKNPDGEDAVFTKFSMWFLTHDFEQVDPSTDSEYQALLVHHGGPTPAMVPDTQPQSFNRPSHQAVVRQNHSYRESQHDVGVNDDPNSHRQQALQSRPHKFPPHHPRHHPRT